jgi:hypothetical protein
MFASGSLIAHVTRGAAGAGALWCALFIAATHPWGSLAFGVIGLLAFRGCPVCWTIGLFEMVGRPWRRR